MSLSNLNFDGALLLTFGKITTFFMLDTPKDRFNGDFLYQYRIRMVNLINYLKDLPISLRNSENTQAYRYRMFVFFPSTGYRPPQIGVLESPGVLIHAT